MRDGSVSSRGAEQGDVSALQASPQFVQVFRVVVTPSVYANCAH